MSLTDVDRGNVRVQLQSTLHMFSVLHRLRKIWEARINGAQAGARTQLVIDDELETVQADATARENTGSKP